MEHKDAKAVRAFGSKWVDGRRSAIQILPSVVACMERNVLIDPTHADAVRIVAGLENPLTWDGRLF